MREWLHRVLRGEAPLAGRRFEALVAQLLHVPAPSGSALQIELEGWPGLRLAYPPPPVPAEGGAQPSGPLPLADVPLALALDTLLPPPLLVEALCALALEERLLLVSSRAAALCLALETLRLLLWPFRWLHPLIALLPAPLLDLLASPTPYLIGLLRELLPSPAERFEELRRDAFLLDLDAQTLSPPMGPRDSPVLRVPPAECELFVRLLQQARLVHSAPDLLEDAGPAWMRAPPSPLAANPYSLAEGGGGREANARILAAAACWWGHVLAGADAHTCLLRVLPEPVRSFKRSAWLAARSRETPAPAPESLRFLDALVSTQAFQFFLEDEPLVSQFLLYLRYKRYRAPPPVLPIPAPLPASHSPVSVAVSASLSASEVALPLLRVPLPATAAATASGGAGEAAGAASVPAATVATVAVPEQVKAEACELDAAASEELAQRLRRLQEARAGSSRGSMGSATPPPPPASKERQPGRAAMEEIQQAVKALVAELSSLTSAEAEAVRRVERALESCGGTARHLLASALATSKQTRLPAPAFEALLFLVSLVLRDAWLARDYRTPRLLLDCVFAYHRIVPGTLDLEPLAARVRTCEVWHSDGMHSSTHMHRHLMTHNTR